MYTWLAMETDGAWARSRMGVALGVGAVAAIIAAGIGGAVIGRVGNKMAALGAENSGVGESANRRGKG